MTFEVTHLKDKVMAGTLISDRRLWLTADKLRVVEEGDPMAKSLLVAKGGGVQPADQERFGISAGSDDKLVVKAQAKPGEKMSPPPENKAVAAPKAKKASK